MPQFVIRQYSFHSSFHPPATSLFWCDFPSLLQPIFSVCKQNLVRCRKEYHIRCLPDRCPRDSPGRSYLQRVLTFSQCAGCKVSRVFTLRLVSGPGHDGRVVLAVLESIYATCNSKFVPRATAWSAYACSWLISECYGPIPLFRTRRKRYQPFKTRYMQILRFKEKFNSKWGNLWIS